MNLRQSEYHLPLCYPGYENIFPRGLFLYYYRIYMATFEDSKSRAPLLYGESNTVSCVVPKSLLYRYNSTKLRFWYIEEQKNAWVLMLTPSHSSESFSVYYMLGLSYYRENPSKKKALQYF